MITEVFCRLYRLLYGNRAIATNGLVNLPQLPINGE
jgi:hypothetical protein